MLISVHIYAHLRCHLPPGESSLLKKEWDVPEGSTIAGVIARLKLPRQVQITVLLNNKGVDSTASLKEGDVVHVLPMMGGG